MLGVKQKVALLSVISNTFLVILKIIVGLSTGAVSVLAEAAHSAVDLLASFIAYFAVQKSSTPADDDHSYGHGKFENISGTIEALLIFLAALWIIYEAIHKIRHPSPMEMPILGVTVMFISCVVNIFVSNKLFKVAKDTDSVALEADAWHLRTDVYTSFAVMAGLAFILLGHFFFPEKDLSLIDPIAAIGVSFLIMRAAYNLTVQSALDLFDVSLPQEELDWIKNYLNSLHPTVRGFHKLRSRKSGGERFIDFHLLVSPYMTVVESHHVTDDIAKDIKAHFQSRTSITIHVEPCDGNCGPQCEKGCLLTPEEREEHQKKHRCHLE